MRPMHLWNVGLVVMSLCCSSALAQTRMWIGTDGNWFEPGNWNPTGVPGSADTAIIGPSGDVTIDPSRGAEVIITGLQVGDNATLTTLPGTQMTVAGDMVVDRCTIIHQDTQVFANNFIVQVAQHNPTSGRRLNPTAADQTEVNCSEPSFPWTFGLGGTVPASPGNVGPGFHATLTADDITLAGTLDVQLHHGFTPSIGDSFRIVDATSSFAGQFTGLAPGSIVATFGDVALVVQYDATGVTLDAIQSNAVPATSTWGLIAMATLLLTVATVIRLRPSVSSVA